jgi:UDP-N-acetylglucosamine 2-epimerase
MKITSIIGARPQFVKLAEMCAIFKGDPSIDHYIIHTGQHYSDMLSQAHIDDLNIPEPNRNLGVNGGTNIENTALMMLGIEKALKEHRPDIVLVYGDTDSTLAGALTARKLGMKIVHMEAGARSGDNRMQEEANRIVVDSISDLLLYVSKFSQHQATIQPWQKGVFTGDLMLDSLLRFKHLWTWKEEEALSVQKNIVRKREYYYMTLHRPETIDNRDNLLTVLNAIGSHLDHPVFLSAHPRLINRLKDFSLPVPPGIVLIQPQRYATNLKLMAGARKVITDSGGMQKESFWLKTPCVTIRDHTEWPETLNFDRNILTGIDKTRIRQAIKQFQTINPSQDPGILFGSGLAAETALNAIKAFVKAISV